MRCVIQRVASSQVHVNQELVSEIASGLLIFLAVSPDDSSQEVKKMARKISQMRIFNDKEGKMNLSIQEIKGEALVVSQFTLYADCSRGNRPYYGLVAPPKKAQTIVQEFIKEMRQYVPCQSGVFGEMMNVYLTNDGPVTIILDSNMLK